MPKRTGNKFYKFAQYRFTTDFLRLRANGRKTMKESSLHDENFIVKYDEKNVNTRVPSYRTSSKLPREISTFLEEKKISQYFDKYLRLNYGTITASIVDGKLDLV